MVGVFVFIPVNTTGLDVDAFISYQLIGTSTALQCPVTYKYNPQLFFSLKFKLAELSKLVVLLGRAAQ